MRAVEIENNGVHRLVSINNADDLNHWLGLGYKPVKVNGKVVIKDMSARNNVGNVIDLEIRQAIEEAILEQEAEEILNEDETINVEDLLK